MKTKKPKPFKLNRQQERMFTSAGFVALRTADGVLEGHPLNLCYWKRGDIRIATTATRSYTMLEFTNAVIQRTYYRTVNLTRDRMMASISPKEMALNITPENEPLVT